MLALLFSLSSLAHGADAIGGLTPGKSLFSSVGWTQIGEEDVWWWQTPRAKTWTKRGTHYGVIGNLIASTCGEWVASMSFMVVLSDNVTGVHWRNLGPLTYTHDPAGEAREMYRWLVRGLTQDGFLITNPAFPAQWSLPDGQKRSLSEPECMPIGSAVGTECWVGIYDMTQLYQCTGRR